MLIYFVLLHASCRYDADSGHEVIDRADGRGDRYCGSIHAFSETPCRHLVTEGKRWVADGWVQRLVADLVAELIAEACQICGY